MRARRQPRCGSICKTVQQLQEQTTGGADGVGKREVVVGANSEATDADNHIELGARSCKLRIGLALPSARESKTAQGMSLMIAAPRAAEA